MVRLQQLIAGVAGEFILAHVENMRGVNLNVFDFDYDLTWAALFLNADEHVYGRYGSRDTDDAEKQLSLAGLGHAMQQALAMHRQEPKLPLAEKEPARTVEEYPAAKQFTPNACIHCHQAYDFRREAKQAAGSWRLDNVWVYPRPENVGVSLDIQQGNRVRAVIPDSPASRLGLRAGDILRTVRGTPIASLADMCYALHHSPGAGAVPVTWQRGEQVMNGELKLEAGWRKTDLSWRASVRSLEPPPCVYGDDLAAADKRVLGLAPQRLAFRQDNFVSDPARHAGIRRNDIILGVDGKALEMNARQFGVYIRLTYKVGEVVTFNILRDGRRIDVPLKLPHRAPF